MFEQFATSRPRPVHLEVPVDVLEGPWTPPPGAGQRHLGAGGPTRPTVEEIAAALDGSRRPLLVAGGGARGAAEQVLALAEYGVPVLTTVNGKGILDESHPAALSAGIRLAAAHRALNDADLLIVVGSELGDSDLWGGVVAPGEPGRRTVVRIDIDPAQMHKNVRADLPSSATHRSSWAACSTYCARRGSHAVLAATARDEIAADAAADAGPWEKIQQVLADALPPDTVVAGDSSQVTYYGTVHYWPFTPANRLLYPTGYATLGYGLPAAIGAKVADPSGRWSRGR